MIPLTGEQIEIWRYSLRHHDNDDHHTLEFQVSNASWPALRHEFVVLLPVSYQRFRLRAQSIQNLFHATGKRVGVRGIPLLLSGPSLPDCSSSCILVLASGKVPQISHSST